MTSRLFFFPPVFVRFPAECLTKCPRTRLAFNLKQLRERQRWYENRAATAGQENGGEGVLCTFFFFLITQTASTCRDLWRTETRATSSASVSRKRRAEWKNSVCPGARQPCCHFGHPQLAELPGNSRVLKGSDGAEVQPKPSVSYIGTCFQEGPTTGHHVTF